MEDWRSAVDEKSGRTYWYHRVTRESTWTRPACFDTPPLPLPSSSSLPDSKRNKKKEEQPRENEEDDERSSSYGEEEGYLHLLSLLQDLGPPSALVSLLLDPSPHIQAEAVQLLLACTLPDTMYFLAREERCVESLVHILLSSSTSSSVDMSETRRFSLRVLCAMASEEKSSGTFMSTRGWTLLCSRFAKWDDLEGSLMFCLLVCLLMKRQTRALVTNDMVREMTMWMCKLSSCLDGSEDQPAVQMEIFTEHPSGKGTSLYDPFILQQLTGKEVNIFSQGLPGMLLLVMMRVAWQHHEEKHQLIASGGLLPLQTLLTQLNGVVIPPNEDTSFSLRAEAQALLLDALTCSDFARHHLLNNWMGLAADVSHLAEGQGRDPLAVKSSGEEGSSGGRSKNKALMDVELRPKDQGTAWRLSSTLLHARCPGMRDMLEDFWLGSKTGGGGLEVSVDCTESVLAVIVHYLHSGLLLPLHIKSMPMLAATLSRQAQREEPDMSVAQIEDDLSAVEDLSSGIMELCRIASELGITQLEQLAADSFVQLCYDSFFAVEGRNADTYDSEEELEFAKVLFMKKVLLLSEQWGLPSLQAGLSFLVHNGYCEHTSQFSPPTPIPSTDEMETDRPGRRHVSPPREEVATQEAHRPATASTLLSPGSLQLAVLTSLDDVESILQEPPSSHLGQPSVGPPQRLEHVQEENVREGPPHGVQSSSRPVSDRNRGRQGPGRGQRQPRKKKGGHGDIYRVLLAESGGDDVEIDTPEYIPLGSGSDDHLFVPRSGGAGSGASGGSKIISMGLEIEEYVPNVHSIQPKPSQSAKKNKRAAQEKRWEEMAVPKHLRKKHVTPKSVAEKKPLGMDGEEEDDEDEDEDKNIKETDSVGQQQLLKKPNVKPNLKMLHKKNNKATSSCRETEEEEDAHSSDSDDTAGISPPPRDKPEDKIVAPRNSKSPVRTSGNGIGSKETEKAESTESPGTMRRSLTLLKKRGSVSRGLRSSISVSNQPVSSSLTNFPLVEETRHQNDDDQEDEAQGCPMQEHDDYVRHGTQGEVSTMMDDNFGDERPTVPVVQTECPSCHRKFNHDAFERHRTICEKVFMQKRKTFDTKKMRTQDNPDLVEAMQNAQKGNKKKGTMATSGTASRNKKAKWKADSEMFRAAMKAGKEVSKAIASGKTLPQRVPSVPDPSLVPCPVCGRTFSEKAAERHIPQCKNIRAKPTTLKKGSGKAGGKTGNLAGGSTKRRSTIL